VKVHTPGTGDAVRTQLLAESGERIVGDRTRVVQPGQYFLGRPYGFWLALPAGEYVVALTIPRQ
jgi:hypothetical protein